MNRNVKAVLFDLDGTLINTLPDIANAMNYALESRALPGWKTDEYRYLVGDGIENLARRAVRDRQDMAEEIRDVYQKRYQEHSRDLSRPYAGIEPLLQRLNEKGIPVCVLSNKPDADTQSVIRYYFPGIRFRTVAGQRKGVPIKPDPGAALSIAEAAGIRPEHFAYLGDTNTDMRCAVNAGMIPVGVLWGFRDEAELRENGAEILLGRPEDLLQEI